MARKKKQCFRFRLRRVNLRNAVRRQLRPPIVRVDGTEAIRQAAQNLQPVANRIIPRVNVPDPLAVFMESVRQAARNLRPVDYRTENGVIVID